MLINFQEIGDLILKIPVNAGKDDKIFGSVTTAYIRSIRKNFNVHRKYLRLMGKLINW